MPPGDLIDCNFLERLPLLVAFGKNTKSLKYTFLFRSKCKVCVEKNTSFTCVLVIALLHFQRNENY